ncbi:hypothetical protein HMSSN036_07490 [Paenibacillus macerans]|nr:hypothetical protein HMSSN036_07490 [Paenibacillus macerans]
MVYIVVGSRIKSLREANNYTREAFAEQVGISSKFLYEIEMGKKGFSADTLHKISQALSVSSDYILTGNALNNKCDEKIIGLLELFDAKQLAQVTDILQSIHKMFV